jgi:hypothetical protein
MDKLKGYRTVVFNAIMTLTMIYTLWQPDAVLPDAETVNQTLDTVEAAIAALWGVGNVVLRAVTSSPIFKQE